MTALRDQLSALFGSAFEAEGLSAELGRVQRSNRPEFAQFQCNGAMAAAKQTKKNPREIAGVIVARLEGEPFFKELSIAGPGFINIRIADAVLNSQSMAIAVDPRHGCPKREVSRTVVLDFGGPNVAKPMHVGHLRSGIVGDAMQQIHKFGGDKTISDVHLGDWGLQMGQIISEIKLRSPDLRYFDETITSGYPEVGPVTLEELEKLYPEASAACKADEARMDLARKATFALQNGRPGYRALWQTLFDVSIAAVKREYRALGVDFDLWKGEADVADMIPDMLKKFDEKEISEKSDGAVIMRVATNEDNKTVPPLMLLNSEGAVGYHTTDMATIIDRVESYQPDFILYITDYRQNLHFEQVFRAARKAGLVGEGVELGHIGFGTMNGPGNTPLKTRDGDLPKLHDLIEDAATKATERLVENGIGEDYPKEERAEVAKKVALAALKFADLSNQPHSNYIFDLERFTTFEGKTGPYLLYAAVRIKSILRKAVDEGFDPSSGKISVQSNEERELVLALDSYAEAFDGAYTKRAPNMLCDFVYLLAQSFSRFYAAHHILSESDDQVRASRLRLAQVTLGEIEQVLGILGISVPDRM
jgi:arginyl-tRNA synthetase